MTRQLEVATIFAKEDGIILECRQSPANWPYYFNCSLISAYSNEDERLFINGCSKSDLISFRSIRNIGTKENYLYYIKSLSLLNKIIIADWYKGKDKEIYGVGIKCCSIINMLYSDKFGIKFNNKIPLYVKKLFNKFINHKTQIKIDLNHLKWYYSGFKSFFVDSSISNLLKFDLICQLFKNATNVKCVMDWFNNNNKVSSSYILSLISMLNNISKNKHTKIKKININWCKLDDDINESKCIELFEQHECKWDIKIIKSIYPNDDKINLFNID